VFRHEYLNIKLLVHGDDFFVLADKKGQEFMQKVLSERYEFRCDGRIGRHAGDQLTVLNRLISYDRTSGQVSYEADPRHAEMIFRQLSLQNAKSVSTPAEKKKASDVLASAGLPAVTAERRKGPNELDFKDLKRLGRYLVGRPRVVNVYERQRKQKVIKVQIDSDHAGCLLTRRPTTGYTLLIGRHCVKHGSNLQSTIALSSGESEHYALVKSTALGMSIQALMEDWGVKYDLQVYSDSSAARGTARRRGLGTPTRSDEVSLDPGTCGRRNR
jgi:hypothetical protein